MSPQAERIRNDLKLWTLSDHQLMMLSIAIMIDYKNNAWAVLPLIEALSYELRHRASA